MISQRPVNFSLIPSLWPWDSWALLQILSLACCEQPRELLKVKRLRRQAADYERRVVLNWEWFCPTARRHLSISVLWQLVVTTEGGCYWHLVGKRQKMLLNTIQCTGWPRNNELSDLKCAKVEKSFGRRPWLEWMSDGLRLERLVCYMILSMSLNLYKP